MSANVVCAFCGKTGPQAEEDLIPMWAGKVLRSIYGPKLDIVYSTRQIDIDGTTVLGHSHERRQTYSAVKLAGICATCNNGWMSQIETGAKPIIEPMIRGVRTAVPVRHLQTLARWLALKTLEADLIPHGYPTAGPADFRSFYLDPNPPPDFRSDFGKIDLQGKPDGYYSISPSSAGLAAGGLALHDPLALEFSFSLGPVWIQTLYIAVAAKTYPSLPTRPVDAHWTTIWPRTDEANWPPPLSFTAAQLPASISQFPEAEAWIAEKVRPKAAGRS